jgi:hypothetical protein
VGHSKSFGKNIAYIFRVSQSYCFLKIAECCSSAYRLCTFTIPWIKKDSYLITSRQEIHEGHVNATSIIYLQVGGPTKGRGRGQILQNQVDQLMESVDYDVGYCYSTDKDLHSAEKLVSFVGSQKETFYFQLIIIKIAPK